MYISFDSAASSSSFSPLVLDCCSLRISNISSMCSMMMWLDLSFGLSGMRKLGPTETL